MNFSFTRKLKTSLRLALNKLRLSKYVNYIGHVKLGSQLFSITLGGYSQGLESLLLLQLSFKTDLLRLAESVANTTCFVDIGANTGQTMLEYFSFRRNGTYYGFEPNPKAYALLQELNKLNTLGANLMPWACSDSNQPTKLYTLSELDSSATVDNLLRADQHRTPLFICEYEFDKSFDITSLPDNFIVKIDVEGAELGVFRGMQITLSTCRPLVICEVLHAHRPQDINSNNLHKAAVEEILCQFRYGIYACTLDRNNRLSALLRIEAFPRDIVYADSPGSVDYVFCPVELQQQLDSAISQQISA